MRRGSGRGGCGPGVASRSVALRLNRYGGLGTTRRATVAEIRTAGKRTAIEVEIVTVTETTTTDVISHHGETEACPWRAATGAANMTIPMTGKIRNDDVMRRMSAASDGFHGGIIRTGTETAGGRGDNRR